MSCYHPLPAWRDTDGKIKLSYHRNRDVEILRLPCGSCLGCRTDNAKAWALRCHLELHEHSSTTHVILTYSNENVPWTLQWKEDVQPFLKRLRKAMPHQIRFFASGEYGEQGGRPHYHLILYGTSTSHTKILNQKWGLGHVHVIPITPPAIAYVAGYTQKKIGWRKHAADHDRVDLETGELYEWKAPFIQMSRRPGIGSKAKHHYKNMWRTHVITQLQRGATRPPTPRHVPRYLHDGWKQQASPQQQEELQYEKYLNSLTRHTPTPEQITAKEAHHAKMQELAAAKRKHF